MEDHHHELHIVVLPWLAFGHLIPFLELSKVLASKGHRISYLSSPRNIARLPKLPSHLQPLINFVHLSLHHVDPLPEDVEATIDIPNDNLLPYLSVTYDGLENQFYEFLQSCATTSPPDWVIHDYAPCWAPHVAARFGVPCVFLSLFSASTLSFIGSPTTLVNGETSRLKPEDMTVAPAWVPFSSSVVFRLYEARKLFKHAANVLPSGVSEGYRFGVSIRDCDFMAIRSSMEFEPEWLRLIQDIFQKPIIPVGLLPPTTSTNDPEIVDSKDNDIVFQWLDQQPPATVVYAAFGSEARLSCEEVREIAGGLDKSRLPFIWVLRRPAQVPDEINMFPEGFDEQIKRKGIVCKDWVPQSKILSHPSIGVFLTHCGLNSVVEGISNGLPLAMLPMVFDQSLNARFMMEKGVGLEVPRDQEDGSFTGDSVAETLRLVMVESEGKKFRIKAKEVRNLGDKELQDTYVTNFIKHLEARKLPPIKNSGLSG